MMRTKSGSLYTHRNRESSDRETCQVESSVRVCTEINDKFEVLPCLLSNLSAVLNDYLTSICRQNPGRDTDLSCFSPTALAWSVLASAVSRYYLFALLICAVNFTLFEDIKENIKKWTCSFNKMLIRAWDQPNSKVISQVNKVGIVGMFEEFPHT